MKPHEYLYLQGSGGGKHPTGCLVLCALALTLLMIGLSLLPALGRAETFQEQPEITQREAVLWFRYGEEPWLAQEVRTVDVRADVPYETVLLSALAAGPDAQSSALNAVFPAEGRVLSTLRSGRTLFVTLSHRTYTARQTEEERRLLLDAIAATVTENCDVDSVQLLLEEGEGSLRDSLRMPASFLPGGSPTEPLLSLTRREEALLTPGNTLNLILALWQQRDWVRLWRYIQPAGESYEEFVARMEALPPLTGFACGGGNPAPEGQRISYTADLTCLRGPETETHTGCVLRLTRRDAVWRITVGQLTGWLEEGAP